MQCAVHVPDSTDHFGDAPLSWGSLLAMADIADSMGLILAARSNMGPDVDALEMSSLKESQSRF